MPQVSTTFVGGAVGVFLFWSREALSLLGGGQTHYHQSCQTEGKKQPYPAQSLSTGVSVFFVHRFSVFCLFSVAFTGLIPTVLPAR